MICPYIRYLWLYIPYHTRLDGYVYYDMNWKEVPQCANVACNVDSNCSNICWRWCQGGRGRMPPLRCRNFQILPGSLNPYDIIWSSQLFWWSAWFCSNRKSRFFDKNQIFQIFFEWKSKFFKIFFNKYPIFSKVLQLKHHIFKPSCSTSFLQCHPSPL